MLNDISFVNALQIKRKLMNLSRVNFHGTEMSKQWCDRIKIETVYIYICVYIASQCHDVYGIIRFGHIDNS